MYQWRIQHSRRVAQTNTFPEKPMQLKTNILCMCEVGGVSSTVKVTNVYICLQQCNRTKRGHSIIYSSFSAAEIVPV